MFNFYFEITVSEVRCHKTKHLCSCLEVMLVIPIHTDVSWTREAFERYRNVWKLKLWIWYLESSRMYSPYVAHVIWGHCCSFTENYYFKIFGIGWDRNTIITVIYLWSSQSCPMQVIGLFFIHKLKKHRPNGHMTAATAHHHVSRAAALALEIYLSCLSSSLDNAIMPVLSTGFKNNSNCWLV